MQHIPHSITFLFHKESAGDSHRRDFHVHFVVVTRKGTVPTLFIVLRDSMPFSLRRTSILDVVPMDSGFRNRCLATQAIHCCGCELDLGGPFIFGLTFESAMVPNNIKMNFPFENSDLLSQAKSRSMADSTANPKTNGPPNPNHSHKNGSLEWPSKNYESRCPSGPRRGLNLAQG